MSFAPVMRPWEHQTRALSRAENREFFAYLMEMGTGKTKVVIDEMLSLYDRGEITTALIIAPKGVYSNWVLNELPAHVPGHMSDEVFVAQWHAGGGTAAQRDALTRILQPLPGLRILVMNTEAFSSGPRGIEMATQFLSSAERSYMVVDESTFIKSPSAQRTKNITRTGRLASFRRIMTGAPVPRSPLDIWAQAEFLKPGLLGQSYFAFRSRYAVLKDMNFGSRRVTTVVGYRNTDELAERIKPWSFRVTKDECLDLPPKIYTTRLVDFTDQQRRIYSEIRDFAIAEIENETSVSAMAVIVQLQKLQQVLCGHVRDDNGQMVEIPTNRVDALAEIVSETTGKVIIWSRFRPDIVKIAARLEKEYGEGTVSQFHGGNTATRDREASEFIHNPDRRFMVSSYAGGHGNTWIVADTVVYYSNSFDLEKRVQSEDRSHRGGQTRRVTYVDLCVPGTVDEKTIKALRAKIDMAAAITGDNYREWVI